MSSAPRFQLLVNGILPGFESEQVQEQLHIEKGLAPDQVCQLLNNEAPLSKALLEHRKAFRLQNQLREMGVDCVIQAVAASDFEQSDRPSLLQPAADQARSSLGETMPLSRFVALGAFFVLVIAMTAGFLVSSQEADSPAELIPKVAAVSDLPLVEEN